MMKNKQAFFILFIFVSNSLFIFGQGIYYRPFISVQYNALTGKGSDLLSTSPRSLGSGVYDFSQNLGLSHLLPISKHWLMLEFDFPLFSINKYRFSKNIYFSNDQILTDTSQLHTYRNNRLSRTGSKMTLISFDLPLFLVVRLPHNIKNSYAKIGFFARYRFWGWHKLIFYQDNTIRIVRTNFEQLQKQGLNMIGWGVSSGIRLNKVYIFGQYNFSRLFSIYRPVHQLSYGIYYFLSLNSFKKTFKHKTKLASYGEY